MKKVYTHFIHNKTRVFKALLPKVKVRLSLECSFLTQRINVLYICLSFSKQYMLIIGIECRIFILRSDPKEKGKEGKPAQEGVDIGYLRLDLNRTLLKSYGESTSELSALGIYPLVLIPVG